MNWITVLFWASIAFVSSFSVLGILIMINSDSFSNFGQECQSHMWPARNRSSPMGPKLTHVVLRVRLHRLHDIGANTTKFFAGLGAHQ